MNRDEALRHQQFNQPCHYTGDILSDWKDKPLYIWDLGEIAAQVSTTPPPIKVLRARPRPISTAWIKLSELTAHS
ncbi:hypothetical protein NIES4103_31410 [Nostoc sp. NIES-4103]|nr:hypothetical protein NIES4103_31410 [Nostoc sp. NIES-4103]